MPDYSYQLNGNYSYQCRGIQCTEEQVRQHEDECRRVIEYLGLLPDEYAFDVRKEGDDKMLLFSVWSEPKEAPFVLPDTVFNHRAKEYRQAQHLSWQGQLPGFQIRRLSQILEELRGLRLGVAKLNHPERVVQELRDLRMDLQALRVPERERKDYTLPLGSACLAVLVLILLFK